MASEIIDRLYTDEGRGLAIQWFWDHRLKLQDNLGESALIVGYLAGCFSKGFAVSSGSISFVGDDGDQIDIAHALADCPLCEDSDPIAIGADGLFVKLLFQLAKKLLELYLAG